MIAKHSVFSKELINAALHEINQIWQYYPSHINSYEEFSTRLPLMTEAELNICMQYFIDTQPLSNCTFFTTSATTGQAKLLVNKLWRKGGQQSYAREFAETMATYVFNKKDIVANLFTPGGFSTLYDGCNRLLEAIGTAILPIGRLDFYADQQQQILNWIQQLQVNTLFGTPSSIMQMLYQTEKYNIPLNIEKIIFTGEPFSQTKKTIILQQWKNAQFYGLYGHAETGFIGFNTPNCEAHHYHFFDQWYFLEQLEEDELVVTSFANLAMPILRYRVGDRANILMEKCSCNVSLPKLALYDRCDQKFNYAGNLIDTACINTLVNNHFNYPIHSQIYLRQNEKGHDLLTIIIDCDKNTLEKNHTRLFSQLIHIPDLYECIAKNAGEIQLASREQYIYSIRQKLPLIVDERT